MTTEPPILIYSIGYIHLFVNTIDSMLSSGYTNTNEVSTTLVVVAVDNAILELEDKLIPRSWGS